MQHRRIPIPQPRRLAAMPPDMIGEAIERLIEALDARAGDADVEPNGDESDVGVVDWTGRDPAYRAELRFAEISAASEDAESDGDDDDGNDAEDEVLSLGAQRCWDAQSPGCPISDPGDVSFTEWQSRGRHKEPASQRTITGWSHHEDDEDDDPQGERSGQGCEGEPDFSRRPKTSAGGPGCIISDPDYGGEEGGEQEEGILSPLYGADQTAGPVNEHSAVTRHFREIYNHSAGL